MKKGTLIVWAIILAVLALVIFQNQEFFLSKQSLRINLGITEEYVTPELPIAVLVLIFFFSGIVIEFFFSLSARFKAGRNLKKLNTTLTTQKTELTGLKSEIDTLKSKELAEEDKTAEIELKNDATQKISPELIGKDAGEKTGEILLKDPAPNPAEKVEDESSKIK